MGFGESVAGLMGVATSKWTARTFASTAVILLGVINVAGVKWVIKLQFILLLILLMSGLDFMVGSFVHTDIGNKLSYCYTYIVYRIYTFGIDHFN